MKLKIELDLGDAVRMTGNPVYTTVSDVFNNLASEIANADLDGGQIMLGYGTDRRKVGTWVLE